MQLSTSEKILIYSSKIHLSANELELINTVCSEKKDNCKLNTANWKLKCKVYKKARTEMKNMYYICKSIIIVRIKLIYK